jgi:hypothetical protein
VSAGFYKRRRGVLEHLQSGKIGFLDLAIHDFLCLKANAVVGAANCTIPPGVCFTSAVELHALDHTISLRTFQRHLAYLEKIKWIKTWHQPGKKGNYPVLICRHSVHDQSSLEYRINGQKTTDWRHPALEVSSLPSKKGFEVATYPEKRVTEIQKKNHPSQDHAAAHEKPDDYHTKLLRFKANCLSRSEDPQGTISTALDILIERVKASGIQVSSPKYFDVALEQFFESPQDLELLSRISHGSPL